MTSCELIISTSRGCPDVGLGSALSDSGLHGLCGRLVSAVGILVALGAAAGPVRGQAARGTHPQEPEGFTRFAEFDFSDFPQSRQGSGGCGAGRWELAGRNVAPGGDSVRAAGSRRVGLLEMREDPTAPASPPGVAAVNYPRGFEAGRGPVNFSGWDAAGHGPNGQKSAIYLSLWIKLDGANYENHAVGTKLVFLGGGLPPTTRGQSGNQVVLFLKGSGKTAVASQFRVEMHQFFPKEAGAPFVARFLRQNVDQRPLVRAGSWHHFEVILNVNDPGIPNGRLRWWIDGALVMNYSNVLYRPKAATQAGFWNLKVNPTWGGTGGRKSRPDAILIDHIYLSGIPLTDPSGLRSAVANPAGSLDPRSN